MENKETFSTGESKNEQGSPIQEIAKMATKMDKIIEEDGLDSGQHKERYGRDGRDSNGVDREGYSRMGYNSDGIDREGFKRNGYNRRGFNREGYLYPGKRSRLGLTIEKWGFDKDGHNHFTDSNLDWRGFNYDGIYVETGEKYDQYGFDAYGRHKVGYSGPLNDWFELNPRWDENGIDYRGFQETGNEINVRTGTKYDINGFDKEGYNEDGIGMDGLDREGFNSEGIDLEGYDRDGFNSEGVDREGYHRDGYNDEGIDREGYNREGLDKDGNTSEYNAKFNTYGVDENGYRKNGEIDPDVEFAIDFAKSGIKDQNKYADERAMDEKEVREKIKAARKKCPNIDEIIRDQLLTGNKMRVAAVANDCEKFIDGSLELNSFWEKHPKLSMLDVLTSFISDIDKRKQFANKTIKNIMLDSDNIENNVQIFSTSRYNVPEAIKGAEEFRRIYARFDIDGSPEQIQKKRENTKKIYDTIKYLNKYKNRNVDSLLGSRQSFDGGQTWVEFTGVAIGEAMDALKKDKRLVCVQTVKDYMINQAKQ